MDKKRKLLKTLVSASNENKAFYCRIGHGMFMNSSGKCPTCEVFNE